MIFPKTLSEVVSHGLCTGCGLCESIAGQALPMKMNAEGFLRPSVERSLDVEIENAVLKSCPGINQTGPDVSAGDPLWGPEHGVFLGYADDPHVRHVGSSGGIVTATALHLLESGAVDAVLHVSADEAMPVRTRAKVSRSREEILEGVGARYSPAAPLQPLHALLSSGDRLAVVGKPCDIAAVRNLARHDPRAARQIVATISFLCAGLPSQTVSRNIIGKYGLAEQDVRLLRYRGYGCPGPTRIETYDDRTFEQTYIETWAQELNQGLQFRCKICPDSTGEQADLVCCDAWDGGEGYPLGDDSGSNVIIARTETGRLLLDSMMRLGVVCAEPMAIGRLSSMQPNHVRRKSQILPRLLGMIIAGQPIPRYRKLRLARAAFHGLRDAWSNIKGIISRLRRGNNRETIPTREETDFV